MNLHLLKLFVCTIQQGSFTKAADALNLTQPAVSRGVRELESQNGTPLLERQGKSLKLTEAGKTLFEYGSSVMSLAKEADERLRSFRELKSGTLIIGASTTIANYWLPPLISQFMATYPGLTLELRAGNSELVQQWLLDFQIDVALIEGQMQLDGIERRPWREEDLVVIAPVAASPMPGKRTDLGECVWIVREPGSGSREASESTLRQMGIKNPQLMQMSTNEAIIQSVAAGCGVGIVPKICARDALALRRVRRLYPQGIRLKRQLYRLRLPQRPLSNAALAFEAILGKNRIAKDLRR